MQQRVARANHRQFDQQASCQIEAGTRESPGATGWLEPVDALPQTSIASFGTQN